MNIEKELKLTYSQLTAWVWNNKAYPKRYYSNSGSFVVFDSQGEIDTTIDVRAGDLFRVMETTTLNNSYRFPRMLVKDKHGNYREHSFTAVNDLLFIDSISHIWLIHDDATHQLVWTYGGWL